MLFKLNIYRLGEERRLQERNRTRALAVVVLLVGLNFVTMALYGQALWNTSRGVTAANARLADVQEILDEVIDEGGAISEEQVHLLRIRSAQPQWSVLMERIGELTPDNVWYMRVSYVKPAMGSAAGDSFLRIYGQVKAKTRDESVNQLMQYVDTLRADAELARSFGSATLATMRWTEESEQEYLRGLHFEVNLPLLNPAVGGGYDGA